MILRLFGSRASRMHQPSSDIDVAVYLQGSDGSLIKETLFKYSIEQGGPLDLFSLSEIDGDHTLQAFFDSSRHVVLGGDSELDDWYESCTVIELTDLITMCDHVELTWGCSTSSERSIEKRRRKMLPQ